MEILRLYYTKAGVDISWLCICPEMSWNAKWMMFIYTFYMICLFVQGAKASDAWDGTCRISQSDQSTIGYTRKEVHPTKVHILAPPWTSCKHCIHNFPCRLTIFALNQIKKISYHIRSAWDPSQIQIVNDDKRVVQFQDLKKKEHLLPLPVTESHHFSLATKQRLSQPSKVLEGRTKTQTPQRDVACLIYGKHRDLFTSEIRTYAVQVCSRNIT